VPAVLARKAKRCLHPRSYLRSVAMPNEAGSYMTALNETNHHKKPTPWTCCTNYAENIQAACAAPKSASIIILRCFEHAMGLFRKIAGSGRFWRS